MNNQIKELLEKSGIECREFIHPQLLKVISSKTTGELTTEGTFPKDETCLIVANHLCIEDVPTLAQAVQEHFYLLVSDEDKYTLDGLGLSLNGVIWIHRTDKNNRKMIPDKIICILNSKKHFAMYPESTWNLSPNLLILPLNYGCIKIALEANVPIPPVVSFFDGVERHSLIGEKYYPTSDLEMSITNLRDYMASLYYQAIETYYQKNQNMPNIYSVEIDGKPYFYEKRQEIDPYYWEKYVDSLYNQYKRAKKDKEGVRRFESQFIFTPKTDDHYFFQVFNSVVRYDAAGNRLIKRITSEKNGYNGTTSDEIDFQTFFGYGYNEKVFHEQLTNLEKIKRRVR